MSQERPFYERCPKDCGMDDYSFDLINSECFGCLSEYEKKILLDNLGLIDFFPRANADADERERREGEEHVLFQAPMEMGDKNKNGQRVKIRGSQFIKREEKQIPKKIIRIPWIAPKPKPKP